MTGSSGVTGASGYSERDTLGSRSDTEVIPVAEEELRIGKRDVSHGRVRVRSYVVETPVSETVALREENVHVERRPVDRAATSADEVLFQDRTIEMEERAEEAVVAKEARVREELVINKEVGERTETVSDTVRRTEVDIEDDRTDVNQTVSTGPAPTTCAPSALSDARRDLNHRGARLRRRSRAPLNAPAEHSSAEPQLSWQDRLAEFVRWLRTCSAPRADRAQGQARSWCLAREARMAKWVYGFGGGTAEGSAAMKDLLGGKGANLAEMASLGLPVPPGFTISTEVCTFFYGSGQTYPPDLRGEVEAALERVAEATGRRFGDTANPLLVSVRSGARASMPA
jgi:uncharacterized protein (TIGR02271 family)